MKPQNYFFSNDFKISANHLMIIGYIQSVDYSYHKDNILFRYDQFEYNFQLN